VPPKPHNHNIVSPHFSSQQDTLLWLENPLTFLLLFQLPENPILFSAAQFLTQALALEKISFGYHPVTVLS